MISKKEKQGARVTRKNPHTDSRTSLGSGTTKSRPSKSVYTVLNGGFRVLYPVGQTTIDKRVLSFAVSSVVAKMKD